MHRYGNLCLMLQYFAPALVPLAPKRKQGHCTLAPVWSRSSWLTSRGPREVCLALISLPLVSLPSEAAPEEVLCRVPRKAWPLATVLNASLMKMGRTGLVAQPRRGPQAGRSGDPRSQNADNNFPWLNPLIEIDSFIKTSKLCIKNRICLKQDSL